MNPTKSIAPIQFYFAVIGIAFTATAFAFLDLNREALIVVGGAIAVAIFVFRPEYGILAFLTTFLLSYPSFLRGSGLATPNNLLGILFCLLLIRRIYMENRIWFVRVRQIQWLAAIGTIFLLSTWLSAETPFYLDPLDRTRMELWNFFSQFAFLIFFVHFIRNRHHLNLVFGLFVLVILFSVPSAIQSALVGTEDYRASAAFGIRMAKNSNHLAFYCLFAIVALRYIRQELQNPLSKFVALGLILVLVICVFLTSSRNALINLIFLTIIFLFEAGLNPRYIILTLLMTVSLGLIGVHVIPEKNLGRITAFTMDPSQKEASESLGERQQSLKVALQLFKESKLLGVGPGNFRWIRQMDYDHKRVATHNSYVWALVSGGIPALLAFLGVYFTTWRDLRWLETQPVTPSLPPMWMIKTTRTALLLFFVFSAFTEAWLEIFPFLLVGVTVVMKRIHDQELKESATE